MESRVQAIFERLFLMAPGTFSEEHSPDDLERWDSLGNEELLHTVENEFGITFEVMDTVEIETAGDLIAMVRRYTES